MAKKTIKVKKDKKIKIKNKNKNTIIVNVNSHNKRKAIQHKTDNKNPPTQMPYVINNSPPQQIQPVIIQQPVQPSYLHYQNPNPIHLASQNANPVNSVPVNGYVSSSNIFQSPRRIPVRIPSNNVIETQTEITGETLEQYQNRLRDLSNQLITEEKLREEDKNNFLDFREEALRQVEDKNSLINTLKSQVREERNNFDDMAIFIDRLRNENKDTSLKADSLFNQLNKEREENQLLNREFNERLKMEEEEKFLLKQSIVKNEMEKNKLRFIIEDHEKVGVLREGRKNNSPNPDIKANELNKKAPLQPSLTSAFATPKQLTPISPIPMIESNYLDTTASNFKATPQIIDEGEITIKSAKLNKFEKEGINTADFTQADRETIIYSLLENPKFLAYIKSKKGLTVTALENGNFDLEFNKKQLGNQNVINLGLKYL